MTRGWYRRAAYAARRSQYEKLVAEKAPLKATCDRHPQRLGQDQYRCPDCNTVWDVDEPRPPCQIK